MRKFVNLQIGECNCYGRTTFITKNFAAKIVVMYN